MPNDTSGRRGIVYLVGAGPGDPGLLTVRGRRLLDECDAVVYDALANPRLFDGIHAERFAVGKRGGSTDSARQDEINALLVRLAREGKRVVRLKGGDPFVFGRGGEEAEALVAAGMAFEVVPGVTAGIAAPAYAGIPVTHRGVARSVTLVTGQEEADKGTTSVDWRAIARAGGTIVLYMAVRALPRIVAALVEGGLAPDTPAAVVRWGTYPRQETVTGTLATLVDEVTRAGLTAPVITIVGHVVSLRDTIAWLEHRPLFGRRILITRAQGQGRERSLAADALTAAGADVLEFAATRIEPLAGGPLTEVVAHLAVYDWIVFTSQHAVALFWAALREAGGDARAVGAARLAAVGPATADALLAHGLVADVVPERFVAEALLDALRTRHEMRGARVLYLAAAGARDVLPRGLRDLGAEVRVVPCYRSVPDSAGASQLRAIVESGEVDLATFTSASAVEAFVEAVGAETARRVPAASIGPITSEALRARGMEPVVEATHSTMAGLVDAIIAWSRVNEGARTVRVSGGLS